MNIRTQLDETTVKAALNLGALIQLPHAEILQNIVNKLAPKLAGLTDTEAAFLCEKADILADSPNITRLPSVLNLSHAAFSVIGAFCVHRETEPARIAATLAALLPAAMLDALEMTSPALNEQRRDLAPILDKFYN